jgi:hypothetical protein
MLSNREFYNRLAQVGGIEPSRRNGRDGFRGVRPTVGDPDPDEPAVPAREADPDEDLL